MTHSCFKIGPLSRQDFNTLIKSLQTCQSVWHFLLLDISNCNRRNIGIGEKTSPCEKQRLTWVNLHNCGALQTPDLFKKEEKYVYSATKNGKMTMIIRISITLCIGLCIQRIQRLIFQFVFFLFQLGIKYPLGSLGKFAADKGSSSKMKMQSPFMRAYSVLKQIPCLR